MLTCGYVLGAVHGFIGEGAGPINLSLLQWLCQELGKHEIWIAADDWNMEPEEFSKANWLEKVRGVAAHQDADILAGTCIAQETAKPSYLDYVVCSARAATLTCGAGIHREAQCWNTSSGGSKHVRATVVRSWCPT